LPAREKDSYSIHSVDNALDVLEALCDEQDDVQISRLSEKLGMNKTSVFRLLATFENRGYVEREEQTGRYRLGLSAYEIGQKLISRMVMLRKARPVMERLVRDCDEAVYLGLRRDDDLLFMGMVDTPQQVKIISLLGRRFPLAEVASGTVILAHEGDERSSGNIGLSEIRQRGWATGHGILGEGIACLAVPLFNADGSVLASLSFLGPDFRLDEQRLMTGFLGPLQEAGQTISSKLGFMGNYLQTN